MERKLIIVALVIVFLAVVVYGFVSLRNRSVPAAQTPATPATVASSSLGTQIYGHAQNPIQNKVPAPSNPAVNPIKGIYKNPF